MFMITTTDGVRVFAGYGANAEGMTADEADASVRDRNARAQAMGIKARYIKVPFKALG